MDSGVGLEERYIQYDFLLILNNNKNIYNLIYLYIYY